MPTVVRWWEDRSAPQRIELYTRWSFYIWLAATPLLALGVVGSAARPPTRPATTVFLLGSVAVAVTAVLLARAGLAAHQEGRALPRGPLLAAFGAAVATAVAAVPPFLADGPDSPALAWGVAMPLAMALAAASTVWPTPLLTWAGFGVGAVTGLAIRAADTPVGVAVALGLVVGATVTFLALAFRFSVWVLDVVREMERSRGVQLQLAVAEERLRFARDLHDVMGRNLSAIAVKSQLAAELVRRGREGAAEELVDISRVAEESLREVRDVVRGYRRTDLAGELAGARSVLRAAGVSCTVDGEEAGEGLPEPVQAALGWVVREAVTNVLRHSRATSCTIALRATGGEAELQVTNDGVSGVPGGWGSGLTGLAERLAGAGGRLTARPVADGFVLTATVPVRVTA
ncbi:MULTISPECIES: sensor histidine kinase [unclassified Geodermatophilus]|uniref:sensor histidine kinase n=1 Tax=unclassified Geodermatophilus TaxID=2637632 RepID=UPI003EE88FBA